MPPEYDGINTGLVAFDLPRFRSFASAFCPGRPWWQCAMQDVVWRHKNLLLADQTVWNVLLEARPEIYRYLPCGVHAEAQ